MNHMKPPPENPGRIKQRIDVSQAMIMVAMGGIMLRRNAHP